MPPNPVLDKLKILVLEFKETIPVVVALRNPALTPSHWTVIKEEIIGKDFDIMDDLFTLKIFIDLQA
jgi:hypothetical protein